MEILAKRKLTFGCAVCAVHIVRKLSLKLIRASCSKFACVNLRAYMNEQN